MRIFVFSTSTNNVTPVLSSLKFLLDPTRNPDENFPELEVFRMDERWNMAAAQAVQGNPDAQRLLQAGQLKIPPERIRMDAEMIAAAKDFKPDIVIAILAWEGQFLPSDETYAEMNKIAPSVHILFDGADNPWHYAPLPMGNITRFHKNKCFAYTVNIDGGHFWPGGDEWRDEATKIPGTTTLTPVDPRYFMGPPSEVPFRERPYKIGFSGNVGGMIRGAIVQRMQATVGPKGIMGIRVRDDHPNSYRQHTDFLRMVQVCFNIANTGSQAAKHVKGRVVEAGYAGCALVEMKNPATRRWLIPRYEFLEYNDADELIELSQWLAGHVEIASEMAFALRNRMVNEHSPFAFWSKVFHGVGLEMFKPGVAQVAVAKAAEPEPIIVDVPVVVAEPEPEVEIIPPTPPVASDGAPIQ